MRIEKDSLGNIQIPDGAYFGVQSARAQQNFPISGTLMISDMIVSLAEIKKAAAIANAMSGQMPIDKRDAIIAACDEIIAGKLHEHFVVDPIQGGAGTSGNMNANEVIANRATEILGGELGKYIVHPNDHVNMSQSTNDVFPTAGKLTTIKLVRKLMPTLRDLIAAFRVKAEEFKDFIKLGRTQLQDAVPVRLGQSFAAYANALERGANRIEASLAEMYVLNMGATAIGTAINTTPEYLANIVPELAKITDEPLVQAEDLIDGTQHPDGFLTVSSALKGFAVALSKVANDLRLLSSGPRGGLGEINLPSRQHGSSIMPGKINPVMPEVVSQVAFRVVGNDATIAMAVEGGQMELNAFEPVAFYSLFESINMLNNACRVFREYCIEGITANDERCLRTLLNSTAMATALVPSIGYEKATTIVKKALKEKRAIIEVACEVLDMESGEVRKIFMNCIKGC